MKTTVQHQMWCELKDGPVRVGDMRGDIDGEETRTATDVPCPFCGTLLVRFGGYYERVLITALVGPPVDGLQLVNIEDIPEGLEILSCKHCRRNFTTPGREIVR